MQLFLKGNKSTDIAPGIWLSLKKKGGAKLAPPSNAIFKSRRFQNALFKVDYASAFSSTAC